MPPGTTLLSLAREVYGDASQELIDRIKTANPQIVDANHILAGDRLRFPELGAPAPRTPDVEEDVRHE